MARRKHTRSRDWNDIKNVVRTTGSRTRELIFLAICRAKHGYGRARGNRVIQFSSLNAVQAVHKSFDIGRFPLSKRFLVLRSSLDSFEFFRLRSDYNVLPVPSNYWLVSDKCLFFGLLWKMPTVSWDSSRVLYPISPFSGDKFSATFIPVAKFAVNFSFGLVFICNHQNWIFAIRFYKINFLRSDPTFLNSVLDLNKYVAVLVKCDLNFLGDLKN